MKFNEKIIVGVAVLSFSSMSFSGIFAGNKKLQKVEDVPKEKAQVVHVDKVNVTKKATAKPEVTPIPTVKQETIADKCLKIAQEKHGQLLVSFLTTIDELKYVQTGYDISKEDTFTGLWWYHAISFNDGSKIVVICKDSSEGQTIRSSEVK
jgi:hypothetical protein